MEERACVDGDTAAGHRRNDGEEEKMQKAFAWVSVGSLSVLLVALTGFMAGSHGEAPLWLVSETCAVLCLLMYIWAYHLTQNVTSTAAVPVEALVFLFPLVFGTGFLAALLAVTVGPTAGVLVMVADVACTSGFLGFCLAEYVRCNMSLGRAQEDQTRAE